MERPYVLDRSLWYNLIVYSSLLSKLQREADQDWWGPWKNTRPLVISGSLPKSVQSPFKNSENKGKVIRLRQAPKESLKIIE
jgi:hypothetical protein